MACLSSQTEFQATVVVAAAAVNLKHYFESPTVDDAGWRGFADPLTAAAAAAVAAGLEDCYAGLATSAVAAAACLQHCFVGQSDFASYLQDFIVPFAAAAAAAPSLSAV